MRSLFIPILIAACATTSTMSSPKGGPRGLRASEHLDVASREEQQARERSQWPETRMMAAGGYDTQGQLVAMPWFRSWDTSGDHEHIAEIHRSKAAALQTAYEEACGNRPADEVRVSPLVRYGVGGWPTASGVIVYLSPKAGTPDQLLAAMKCHRAFMMLTPSDMDDCPLDLPGLALDARGDLDGVTVSMTVSDSALISELKRRAAHDLEAGQHQGSGMSPHMEHAEHRP